MPFDSAGNWIPYDHIPLSERARTMTPNENGQRKSTLDLFRNWSDQQYNNFLEQKNQDDAAKYDFSFIDNYKFPSQQKGMLDDLLQQPPPSTNQNPIDIFGDYFNKLNQEAVARKAQQPDQPDFATLESQSMQGVTPPQPQEPSLWEAINNKDKFEQKFSGFTDLMKKLSKPVHDFMDDTAPGQFVQRLSETGADTSTAGTSAIGRGDKASTGNNVLDTIADVLGMGAGTLINPGGAPSLGNVMNETGRAGGALFDRATQSLNPTSKLENFLQGISKKGVEGTAAGLPFSLSDQANDAMYTDKSLAERAKEVAQESALFGLGDGALYGVGKGVGKALDTTGIPQQMALAKELNKATPEPGNPLDQLLNRPASIYEAKPIQQTIDEPVLKPNEGPLSQGKFKVVNPAAQQLDDLYALAQENGLPPGREYEYLQGLWSSIAPKEAGTLDDLIQTATKETNTDSMIQAGSKNMENMKDAQKYGVYPNLKLGEVGTKQTTREVNPYPTFEGNQGLFNLPQELVAKNLESSISKAPEKMSIDELLNRFSKSQDGEAAVPSNSTPLAERMASAGIPKAEQPQGINELLDSIFGSSKQAASSAETMTAPKVESVANKTASTLEKPQVKSSTEQPKTNPVNGVDASNLKDISGPDIYTNDVYRNFKKVFGPEYEKVKQNVLDPFDSAKKDYVDMQKEWTDKLKTEVVNKLGINKDSKLSALVQQYGEKEISLDELKQKAPKDWQKVVEADKWFRSAYDSILDQVNVVRAKIYPGQADRIVPKRDDYYRHFQEFTGLTGLKNIFDTPAQIDPKLVGLSPFTQPKSKFQGWMQKRGLGPFKRDAVGGFLEYLPGASYAKHIDPHIDVFKGVAKELANQTEKSKHLNNFIDFVQKFSQDLAGKTNPIDRVPQDLMGRKLFTALNWLNNRAKANTVLGNASSALAQVANIPNGIAFAKQYSVPGAIRTMTSIFDKNSPMAKSGFLAERFERGMYRPFDAKWLDVGNPLKLKSLAEWIMETSDRIGTNFVWNSAYAKGIGKGIKDPIKFADDETRRLIAGRGIGEVPLAQKSKVIQLIMPFTLEVANLWKVQKEFVKAKDVAGLATLFIANHLLNKGMETVRGSDVTFDPIKAVINASEKGLSPLQRGGRIASEVLSNMPLGSSLGTLYPEYGFQVGDFKGPTRKELFGKDDPSRFGAGPLLAKAVQDPYLMIPGFGGNQVKKSYGGYNAVEKGGVFTKGGDKLMFPVKKDPVTNLQELLFGPYSTQQAQQYFDKERKPLSAKETLMFEKAKDKEKIYNMFQKERDVNKVNDLINNLRKDKKIDPVEKKQKLKDLIDKLKQARAQ